MARRLLAVLDLSLFSAMIQTKDLVTRYREKNYAAEEEWASTEIVSGTERRADAQASHGGQDHAFEQKPPFGWYDRPENQMALLGRVL